MFPFSIPILLQLWNLQASSFLSHRPRHHPFQTTASSSSSDRMTMHPARQARVQQSGIFWSASRLTTWLNYECLMEPASPCVSLHARTFGPVSSVSLSIHPPSIQHHPQAFPSILATSLGLVHMSTTHTTTRARCRLPAARCAPPVAQYNTYHGAARFWLLELRICCNSLQLVRSRHPPNQLQRPPPPASRQLHRLQPLERISEPGPPRVAAEPISPVRQAWRPVLVLVQLGRPAACSSLLWNFVFHGCPVGVFRAPHLAPPHPPSSSPGTCSPPPFLFHAIQSLFLPNNNRVMDLAQRLCLCPFLLRFFSEPVSQSHVSAQRRGACHRSHGHVWGVGQCLRLGGRAARR